MMWGLFWKTAFEQGFAPFPVPSPPPPPQFIRNPPPPPRAPLCCNVSPKVAHFEAFCEIASAKMGQKWLKIALNHLFEHPLVV